MPRTILRRLAALLIVALGAAACTDSPTGANGGAVAELGFSLDLSGTSVTAMAVQVTASDIPEPLVFNIPVSNGTASGTIRVPAGAARTITVLAYDDDGHLTHQGSRTVEVLEGANNTVAISLMPLTGDVPITVNFGSLVITVSRKLTPLSFPAMLLADDEPVWTDDPGSIVDFVAVVTQANGTVVPGVQVRWASLNPSVASIDSTGRVLARNAGSTEIVATYAGFAGSIAFHVTGDGTNGTTDVLAPFITGLTISTDTVDVSGDDPTVTLSVTAWDKGSGVDSIWVGIFPPSNSGIRACAATRQQPQGSSAEVTLSCTIDIPPSSDNGEWGPAELYVSDAAGNVRSWGADGATDPDMDQRFVVIGGWEDDVAPEVYTVDFSQDTVVAPGEMSLVVEAWDGASGLGRMSVLMYSAESGSYMECQVAYAVGQTYTCRFKAEGRPAGVYGIYELSVYDLSGNMTHFAASELAEIGLDRSFVLVVNEDDD
jgi:Bacterial Ig-like domain (group 2)